VRAVFLKKRNQLFFGQLLQMREKMKLKPVGERIIVQYRKLEQKKGALIIPNEEPPQFATVIQDCFESHELGIYKDDLVALTKYAGTAFKVDDQLFLIIEMKDVIGKLEKDDVS